MKFTATGSITVGVDAVLRQDGQVRLRFEVTDTGIGIAPEAHERIFDVFTQADETVVNIFGGTGLGLALVRKSVQLLGGEIGVESTLGAGSTFWFELPMQCQPDMAEAASHFTQLHALVLTHRPDAMAPLLGRLTEWGVTIEHTEAAEQGWPVSTDPNSAGLLAFANLALEAPQRPLDRLSVTGAGSFIEVREGEAVSLPDAAAQRCYANILTPGVTDSELRNVLHFISAARAQREAPAEAKQPSVARESFSLLVADDNATNRYVLDTILRSAGHRVTLVNNGEEALDALAEHRFDAAVLDVNMPLMSGIEAAKTYRMIGGGTELVPLLALTADATPATREDCLEAGMAACLVKPVEPAQLFAILDEVVAKARAARPQPESAHDPRVTEISTHPRFRGNLSPAVDFDVLAGLRGLGDEAFLLEVVGLFRGEARAALGELHIAAKRGDVLGFRTHAHALRSVAANIGARQLYDICMPLQIVSATELRQQSTVWLEQIEAELSRVEMQLDAYCSPQDSQARS
jgi:two-component system sensor histidine kinase RpfC